MTFWCKGKKDYCQDSSSEACNACQYEDGSGGIELDDDDDDVFIGQWISVKDWLPKAPMLVLVCVKHPLRAWITTDVWLGDRWLENADEAAHEITHWMPLPEPPKAG